MSYFDAIRMLAKGEQPQTMEKGGPGSGRYPKGSTNNADNEREQDAEDRASRSGKAGPDTGSEDEDSSNRAERASRAADRATLSGDKEAARTLSAKAADLHEAASKVPSSSPKPHAQAARVNYHTSAAARYRAQANKVDEPELTKGDVPGHEFHGNQYSAGGAAREAAIKAAKQGKAPVDIHLAAKDAARKEWNSTKDAGRKAAAAKDYSKATDLVEGHSNPRKSDEIDDLMKFDEADTTKTDEAKPTFRSQVEMLPGPVMTGAQTTKPPEAPTLFKAGSTPVADKKRALQK